MLRVACAGACGISVIHIGKDSFLPTGCIAEVVNVDAQARLILADIARMGAVKELALGYNRSGITCRKERRWRANERGRARARDARREAVCMR